MHGRGDSGTSPAPTLTAQITAIERELAASRPARLRPPPDLLAFLGTRRGWSPPWVPPGPCSWWRTLRELPVPRTGPEPPTLRARRNGRQLWVWCKYCRKHHYHAAHSSLCGPECPCPMHTDSWARFCLCETGSGDGHRGAHCTDSRSPYRPGGYVLREVPR
jgi:hypothetical protein